MVKSWRDNDIISNFVYKKLNCTNGNLPRCYKQPKIHKKEFSEGYNIDIEKFPI